MAMEVVTIDRLPNAGALNDTDVFPINQGADTKKTRLNNIKEFIKEDVINSLADISGKADKVAGAVEGNLAGFDASGNLTDSGSKADDFIPASTKGAAGGVATLNVAGTVPLSQLPAGFGSGGGGGSGKKYATVVIGNADAGHTLDTVDYLCTGVDDHLIINSAIDDLPAEGGKVVLLEGTYKLGDKVHITKDNVTLRGMGYSTKLQLCADVQGPSSNTSIIHFDKCKYCIVTSMSVVMLEGIQVRFGVYVDTPGIYGTGRTSCTVENCFIYGQSGVYLTGGGSKVIDCIVEPTTGHGIIVEGNASVIANNEVVYTPGNNKESIVVLNTFYARSNIIIGNICQNGIADYTNQQLNTITDNQGSDIDTENKVQILDSPLEMGVTPLETGKLAFYYGTFLDPITKEYKNGQLCIGIDNKAMPVASAAALTIRNVHVIGQGTNGGVVGQRYTIYVASSNVIIVRYDQIYHISENDLFIFSDTAIWPPNIVNTLPSNYYKSIVAGSWELIQSGVAPQDSGANCQIRRWSNAILKRVS
jgi:hypothetical protein